MQKVYFAAIFAAVFLVGCTQQAEEESQTYRLDKSHSFLTFRVGHNNDLSSYRVTLTDFDAVMTFDSDNPEASSVTATINPLGIQTNFLGAHKGGTEEVPYNSWNEDIARNPTWLNADTYPEIVFTSTEVTKTSETSGTVTGELNFLGQVKPITLETVFNGSGTSNFTGERIILGFDARTTLTRSEWGITRALPAIVGDTVEIAFTGQFLQDE